METDKVREKLENDGRLDEESIRSLTNFARGLNKLKYGQDRKQRQVILTAADVDGLIFGFHMLKEAALNHDLEEALADGIRRQERADQEALADVIGPENAAAVEDFLADPSRGSRRTRPEAD